MNSPAVNLKNLWKFLAVAAAIVFLYAGVLSKLGYDWWTDENYSHGLLVPFVIGFIVWAEFDELKKAVTKPSFRAGFPMILLALFMLLAGTLGAELFTRRISFALMLAGIVVYFFGANILKFLAVPFLLLLLAIPIPQIIFNKIAFPLQLWASQCAIWGIRLFEVASVRKGNVIEILPQGATQVIALEVVEACSGIRSLMTLVTLALILAYFTRENQSGKLPFWKNADFWRGLALMLSAVPIAILTNAARVTATGVLTYYYGKRATEGAWHEAAGWLVYVVALILLIAVNTGLKFVFRKVAKRQSETFTEDINLAADYRLPTGKYLSALLIILLTGGVFINWFERRGEAETSRKPLIEIPQKLGEWRQKGDEIRFEAQTETVLRTTDYTMREYFLPGGRVANLYVGYYASQRSGATYHSPQNCLPGAGWVMKDPQRIEITTAAGKTFIANRYIVENGLYKEVMIYWYQGRGRTEADEYTDKIYTVWDSVLRRRSDGAMVRVMTSVGGNETEAVESAVDLSAQLAENLSEFVPE
jgi:exosortase D (VPLPA-CTERM-specific)